MADAGGPPLSAHATARLVSLERHALGIAQILAFRAVATAHALGTLSAMHAERERSRRERERRLLERQKREANRLSRQSARETRREAQRQARVVEEERCRKQRQAKEQERLAREEEHRIEREARQLLQQQHGGGGGGWWSTATGTGAEVKAEPAKQPEEEEARWLEAGGA